MNVSNNSCVSQMQKCIVDYGSVGGRGVEDGEVSVSRGVPIEVCMGEGAGV